MKGPLLAISLCLALGCDVVDYIEIDPPTVLLTSRRDGRWLSAKAMSHQGMHYPKAGIGWSVKDPKVASVDEKGRITAVESGVTEVIAKHGSVTASAIVEVRYPVKMKVTPEKLSLTEGGGPAELQVQTFDFQGRELKDRTPTFQARDKEVVSMGQNAAFPVRAGQTEIEVSVGELKEKVSVTVAPERGHPSASR